MRWWVALSVTAMTACSSEPPRLERLSQPLEAFCTADVEGVGQLDTELEYLPNVVNCENGAADFEALKAQAVAARSYLYYRLETGGSISDGTGDQVYSCGREPSDAHRLAVEETSGMVLQYQGTQVAAFYVAGSLQDPPECRGGTNDPTNTERYVTYNEGLSGDGIVQTTLGFVDPSNLANRGCMSQNGSDCLSEQGRGVDSILRFYYGDDIEVVTAEGPCIVGQDVPDAGVSSLDANAGDDGDDGDDGEANGGGLSAGCSTSGESSSLGFSLALAVGLLVVRRRRILHTTRQTFIVD